MKKCVSELGHKNIIYKDILERICLVKNSLLSASYQNIWVKIELKQILNRLFILIQEPCAFIVLQKLSDDSFKVIHHTMQDPLWKRVFQLYLIKNIGIKKEGDLIIHKDELGDCILQLFGNIHVVICKIERKGKTIEFPPIFLNESMANLASELQKALNHKIILKPLSSGHIEDDILNKFERWNESETGNIHSNDLSFKTQF